jgi:tetratricopeptide (TPR) repeat protein
MLAILTFASSQTIEFETMSDLVNRGAEAFASGDYVQAANAFQKLESVYSSEPEWEANRLGSKIAPLAGYAALKAGLFDQAIASLQQFASEESSDSGQDLFVKYTVASALKNKGAFVEALDAFARFRDATQSVSQQSIAWIHEADIHARQSDFATASSILERVSESTATAIRIRTHARIRLLQAQLDQKDYPQAAKTLIGRPWESDTMPEMALLAFLSIEAGDLFLSNGFIEEARQAYRLTPSKDALVEKQKRKLANLKQTFQSRKDSVGMGGIMWTDFYEQLIAGAAAQLSALEKSDDYSEPLQLRRGRSTLLAKRGHEAWLIFERLSQTANTEVAEVAHFNWILAAKELNRYSSAIAIARDYLKAHPASESVDDALSLIAHTLIDAGRYEDAIAALSELITDAADPILRTVSTYQRGQCYLRIASYGNAHSDFSQVEEEATSSDLVDRAILWRGISHFMQNDFNGSLPIFASLMTASQNREVRGEAHYRYACCLYSTYDYTKCATSLLEFADRYSGHPRQYEARLLLGDAYAADNELEAALEQYQAVPGEIEEIGHLAAIQSAQTTRELGRISEALESLGAQFKLTRDPFKRTEIQLMTADLYLQLGETDRAHRLLQEAIADEGDSPVAENMMEVIRVLDTIEPIQALLLKDNALAEGRFRLAGRYWLFHVLELKEADHIYQSRVALLALANEIPIEQLPPECLAHVGLELTQLEFNSGPAMLDRLTTLFPDSNYTPYAYFGFAVEESRAEEHAVALGWLNRMGFSAIDLPIFVDSLILEGKIRTEVDEFSRAQETLENALSYRWASSNQKANCLLQLAGLKKRQGQLEQAIAYCQRVFTLYPGAIDASATGYLQSAQHLTEIEEPAKAKEVLEEFMRRSEYRHTESYQKAKQLLASLNKTPPS